MSAYGAAGDEVGSSVIQTSDGGYAIAGTATNGSNTADTHITIVKADSTDNMLWATGYGTGGDVGSSIVQTSDGGFAIAGSTIPSMTNSLTTGGKILWLVKMDSTGNEVWNRGSGGVTGESVGNSVVKTSDGGYAVAGYTTSFGAGDRDVYLVKINSDGNIDQSFNPSPSTEPTPKVPEFPAQFIGITLIVVMIAILSVVILAKKKIKN
jgi:hypothetical protein